MLDCHRARRLRGRAAGRACCREEPRGRVDEREWVELAFAVALLDGAAFEGPVAVEQDGHVVVGVVAEPDRDAGGGVVAEGFPGAPERFEAADGFGVSPPFRAPGALGAVERAAVHRRELLAHELVQGRVEQLRLLRVARVAGGGCVDEFVAPAAHARSPVGAGCSRAWTSSSEFTACSSVVLAAGSCSRSDSRTSLARGPVIHGRVHTSVGGAPAASTIARPLGNAARSATSRMRSRSVACVLERPVLACETEVVWRVYSPTSWET